MLPKNRHAGFTIVELLIVIVVIGILVAIVIVAYTGITRSAKDASIQSDLKNVQKVVDIYQARYGQYPTTAQLATDGGVKINKGQFEVGGGNNFYYCVSTGRTRFAIGAAYDGSRNGFVYDSETGMRSVAGPSPGLWGASTCPNTVSGDPAYGTDKAYYSSSSSAPASSGCVWTSGACVWQSWLP